MGLSPTVRVIEEGSGVVLYTLPPFTSLPSVNDELVMSEDGGPQVVYKVKSIQHVLNTVTQTPGQGGADTKHVGGTVDLTVKVV